MTYETRMAENARDKAAEEAAKQQRLEALQKAKHERLAEIARKKVRLG